MKRRAVLASLVSGLLAGAPIARSATGAGGGVAARSADAAPPAPVPPSVKRGESPKAGADGQRANVDWLNATFPDPGCSPERLVAQVSRILRRPVSGRVTGRHLLGFSEEIELVAHVGSRKQPMGSICHGGEAQKGRWLLQITGSGCALVPSWPAMVELLETLDAKITRLDLCVDFLDGQWTVDDARDSYIAGRFIGRGREPGTSQAGDWVHNRSRTFYVGAAKNGKVFRAYEKGHQLGDLSSNWVRFEVQFGNRDRVIPFDALLERDKYFAGAYPVLADALIDAEPERIETTRTEGEVTLGHLLTHLRRGYGKAIDALSATLGFEIASLVEEVRVTGTPRRLKPSTLASAPTWAAVSAQARKASHG